MPEKDFLKRRVKGDLLSLADKKTFSISFGSIKRRLKPNYKLGGEGYWEAAQILNRDGEYESGIKTLMKAATCFKFAQDLLRSGKCEETALDIAMEHKIVEKCRLQVPSIAKDVKNCYMKHRQVDDAANILKKCGFYLLKEKELELSETGIHLIIQSVELLIIEKRQFQAGLIAFEGVKEIIQNNKESIMKRNLKKLLDQGIRSSFQTKSVHLQTAFSVTASIFGFENLIPDSQKCEHKEILDQLRASDQEIMNENETQTPLRNPYLLLIEKELKAELIEMIDSGLDETNHNKRDSVLSDGLRTPKISPREHGKSFRVLLSSISGNSENGTASKLGQAAVIAGAAAAVGGIIRDGKNFYDVNTVDAVNVFRTDVSGVYMHPNLTGMTEDQQRAVAGTLED